MIVTNAEASNVLRLSLDHPKPSHEISNVSEISADSNATKIPVPVTDQIAMSLATKFLQQATNSGEEIRLERILQTEDGDCKGAVSFRSASSRSSPG